MARGLVAESISVPHARLSEVTLQLAPGELLGLVGPSGVGKTTLARVLSGAIRPDSGRVLIDGQPLSYARSHRRTDIALIGQDPRAACNPRWSLERIITEPQRIAGADADAVSCAERALLPIDLLGRKPDEVSDGQLQRACIARALAQRPRYLLCDEPTSALDPAKKKRIATVLRDIADSGVGVLFISHEHALVESVADRVVTL